MNVKAATVIVMIRCSRPSLTEVCAVLLFVPRRASLLRCEVGVCAWKMTSNTTWYMPSSSITEGGVSTVESEMYHSMQAVLQLLDQHDSISAHHKGMLRWSLHKKVQKKPLDSTVLVETLVKELERVQWADCVNRIIPLLQTLIYAVMQSVYIPEDLCKRVYDCCKTLLTFPQPYCGVGLSYTRCMKTEHAKPGALYQRKVLAEQRMQNEAFPFQEVVFVFGDPAVISGPVETTIRKDLEQAAQHGPTFTLQCKLLLHTLKAALGQDCHTHALALALKNSDCEVERYFQEVVEVVEQSEEEEEEDHGGYRARLQQIYHRIVPAGNKGVMSSNPLSEMPLPSPEIRFHLWKKEEDLCTELEKFMRQSYAELVTEMQRMSTDSGIEMDLSDSEPPVQPWLSQRVRVWKCLSEADRVALAQHSQEDLGASRVVRRRPRSGSAAVIRQPQHLTAHVVVMGDDRVLGMLAKACCSLRTKDDTTWYLLTERLNLQMYYVPITNQCNTTSPAEERKSPHMSLLDLATYLGRVDPWYECSINGLAHTIPLLAETQSRARVSSDPPHFLVDVLSYYIRMGQQPVHFPIYAVKISFSSLTKEPEQDVFVMQLEMDFPEFRNNTVKLKGRSFRQKRSISEACGHVVSINYRKVSLSNREVETGLSLRTAGILLCAASTNKTEHLDCLAVTFKETLQRTVTEPMIRTCNIKIRTVEDRAFTVCLDKDSRRTYRDVQSVDVSLCPRETFLSKFSMGEEKEAELSKHMTKGLSLPINTFSGLTY
ncbi:hypothetical protein MATL_G00209610 [Megalops atlanticus]|uniref:Phosphoinositide 3-kinase regulatory subunit 6 n=1 Tax=Megalops atlanticus TaxID=7932 RepID=A0A9D3T336_MEGAT|nr:hypothetical protein MATL_G00209610 [Megalops atlanticus]